MRTEFWIFVPCRAQCKLRCRPEEFVSHYFGQDYPTSITRDSRGCVWYWIRTANQYHNVAALVWNGDDPRPRPSKAAPPPPPKLGLWRRFVMWATKSKGTT